MRERFRNIGFILIILISASGIIYFFSSEHEVQQNVLDFSLNLMGDKLFAMVPEGSGKDELNELYKGFKQRALDGIVPVEQVEIVAANVLNVSNTETELTSEQAKGILNTAVLPQIASASAQPSTGLRPPEPVLPEVHKTQPHPEPVRPDSKKLEELGERMKTMFDFNEDMLATVFKDPAKRSDIVKQMRYQAQNGLKLVMDAEFKEHLHGKESEKTVKGFERMEQEDLLEWQENLAEEMAKQAEARMEEMKALHASLEEIGVNHVPGIQIGLDVLKSLEGFDYIPVDIDSIIKAVEKDFRDANISIHNEEPE
ncbi:hypothetical protein HQ585_15610 [candidate division KSB1 bacterium]|nr:hypothetical protein [candidate division KSB1 bacterium]